MRQCPLRTTVKTASLHLKRIILQKIFLTGGVNQKKSQLFHTKCWGCFIIRDGRFALIPRDAHMSPAYDGIRQTIFARREIPLPGLRPEGGR